MLVYRILREKAVINRILLLIMIIIIIIIIYLTDQKCFEDYLLFKTENVQFKIKKV